MWELQAWITTSVSGIETSVCVRVSVCMCARTCTHAWTHVQVNAILYACVEARYRHLIFETRSLSVSPKLTYPPISTPSSVPDFYVGARDLNSGPCAGAANTLPTEPLPLPAKDRNLYNEDTKLAPASPNHPEEDGKTQCSLQQDAPRTQHCFWIILGKFMFTLNLNQQERTRWIPGKQSMERYLRLSLNVSITKE